MSFVKFIKDTSQEIIKVYVEINRLHNYRLIIILITPSHSKYYRIPELCQFTFSIGPTNAFLPVILLCSIEHLFPWYSAYAFVCLLPLLHFSIGLSSGRGIARTQLSPSLKIYHNWVIFHHPFPQTTSTGCFSQISSPHQLL